jgi:hypothetical protein
MAWLVRVLLLQDLLQSCSRGGGYPRQWCVFIVPAGRDNNQSHGPAYGPLKKRATGAVAPKSSRACEWGGGDNGRLLYGSGCRHRRPDSAPAVVRAGASSAQAPCVRWSRESPPGARG